MTKKIAIIVLGCASPPYDVMIDTIRTTWAGVKAPGIDIYYLYGNPDDDYSRSVLSRYIVGNVSPVKEDEIKAIGDVLIAGCGDNFRQQEDCILRKRLIAFGYLASVGVYDLIYTVCATSYVDQQRLKQHADHLTTKRMISGVVSLNPCGIPFVSGASMLMSTDVAWQLSADRHEIIEQNRFGFRDDVTIGHWIVTRMSKLSLETFADDVRRQNPMTPAHIFVPYPRTTVDYVMAPAEKHRPVADAFHYHFHSRKPGDMIGFHRRYFSNDL
ncbi:hypothetical protein ACFL27_06175 [candidate division CSSED10-310 bacterium]|uniref:Polysaccharide pyruvyl transferase domain-containing protein n=1 Tax=candidate division CSSED10-310 bacterium TaxID=2855610 RepID=A0ABV6YU94_UNCC1